MNLYSSYSFPLLHFPILRKMHQYGKELTYAALYSGYKEIQRTIDEEGCGAFFAEACRQAYIWEK